MSRSQWAWTKSFAPVSVAVRGAGRLTRHGLRARPGGGRLVRAVSSLIPLSCMATAVMLMAICSPAGALGKVGSPHNRASAASDTRRASRTAGSAPKPRPPRTIAGLTHLRAELLAIGAGYSATHGSSAVRRLQHRLVRLGYSPGRIDGRYGPLTERAVISFQSTRGLQVDGIAGPLTLAALVSAKPVLQMGSGYQRGGSSAVRQVQHDLAAAGYRPGPVDGRYGPLTERAVMRFQRARHLRIDGIAGPQTLGHLETPVNGRAHHRQQRVRSRPRTTPRRSRPTPAGSNGAPSPTRASSPRPRGGRRSAGSSSILWIVALVCLLLDRTGRSTVAPAVPPGGRSGRPVGRPGRQPAGGGSPTRHQSAGGCTRARTAFGHHPRASSVDGREVW